MAKGNPFLGFARGSVGDVVLTHMDGTQVTRARNRAPKNPRSALQLVQRSILKTISSAYSVMSEICDHSFEGYALGTPCQSRFQSININMLRDNAASVIQSGDEAAILACEEANYMSKFTTYPVINAYRISEGTLPQVAYNSSKDSKCYIESPTGKTLTDNSTYQNVIDYLGCEAGDQLTFMWLYGSDLEEGEGGLIKQVEIARVILMPSDGDLTSKFFTPDGVGVTKPNTRNTGYVYFTTENEGAFEAWGTLKKAGDAGGSKIVLGFACILSRYFAGKWRRSTQNIMPLTFGWTDDHKAHFLGDAVASFRTEPASSLYLNQAD